MSTALLPHAFWFRVAVDCPRVEDILRADRRGQLLSLSEACILPSFARLDGRATWATVRAGWNPTGLAVSIVAEGLATPAPGVDRPESFADVNLWIDTRDTRNVSRATRFCHRFSARLNPSRDGKALEVEWAQRPIARAMADAPLCDPDQLQSRCERGRRGWSLELFLPSAALHGFDPDTNRRLGFAYQVSDHVREDQFLGIGREFPLGENPSLWATLVLAP